MIENIENDFRQWLSQKIAQAIDKAITRQICRDRMVVGDGKSIFTDKDREQLQQFLSNHKN